MNLLFVPSNSESSSSAIPLEVSVFDLNDPRNPKEPTLVSNKTEAILKIVYIAKQFYAK